MAGGEALYKKTKTGRRGKQIRRKGVRSKQVAKTRDQIQPLVSERRAARAKGDKQRVAELSSQIQEGVKKSGFYKKKKGGGMTARTAPRVIRVTKGGPVSATKQKKTQREYTKTVVAKKAGASRRKDVATARKQQKTLKFSTKRKKK